MNSNKSSLKSVLSYKGDLDMYANETIPSSHKSSRSVIITSVQQSNHSSHMNNTFVKRRSRYMVDTSSNNNSSDRNVLPTTSQTLYFTRPQKSPLRFESLKERENISDDDLDILATPKIEDIDGDDDLVYSGGTNACVFLSNSSFDSSSTATSSNLYGYMSRRDRGKSSPFTSAGISTVNDQDNINREPKIVEISHPEKIILSQKRSRYEEDTLSLRMEKKVETSSVSKENNCSDASTPSMSEEDDDKEDANCSNGTKKKIKKYISATNATLDIEKEKLINVETNVTASASTKNATNVSRQKNGQHQHKQQISQITTRSTSKYLPRLSHNTSVVNKVNGATSDSKNRVFKKSKTTAQPKASADQKEQLYIVNEASSSTENKVNKIVNSFTDHRKTVTTTTILAKTINTTSISTSGTESSLQLENSSNIDPEELVVYNTVLGEGQVGTVRLAKYRGIMVACKSKRPRTQKELYNLQAKRELYFAGKLSVCRFMNRYIGWLYCPNSLIEKYAEGKRCSGKSLYSIQKYIPNGDARSYLNKRATSFLPIEALQAAICLFSALTDAHNLNIGIVDIKLENFLIDNAGSGWLTDFGSCVEFADEKTVIDLDKERVAWTTHVAAPEMIRHNKFSKASDVFMATLLVAELLTADTSDKEFSKDIIARQVDTGNVKFSHKIINSQYQPFYKFLSHGLKNDPKKRPTAENMLIYLLEIKIEYI